MTLSPPKITCEMTAGRYKDNIEVSTVVAMLFELTSIYMH